MATEDDPKFCMSLMNSYGRPQHIILILIIVITIIIDLIISIIIHQAHRPVEKHGRTAKALELYAGSRLGGDANAGQKQTGAPPNARFPDKNKKGLR